MARTLVTGGAGFIGSQLTEQLLERGDEVVVVDDFSSGRREWVADDATLVERDLTDPGALEGVLTADIDRVFHLAASKAVDTETPHEQFRRNTQLTATVLQAMHDAGVSELAYTSSSTVYGEAPRPTPEDHSPLEPISMYGASKLADEGLLSTYAYSHDMTVWNVRFANIVGPRLRGAVIPDFIDKLRADPTTLTILGDGRQQKSYMHVSDCIDALLTVVESTNEPMNTFNLGTQTTTSVTQIAGIVSDELGLEPAYEYTGGDRGWVGDVPKMRLAIDNLCDLGWEPTLESDQAVRRATAELITELEHQPPVA
ncbi:NAD-dependent epimerase/dehydratase family protein [Natronolimnobius sp. AArcel1]|uniref:NAD-dependent epimerase/dehydratase family protein n=1 Tax=Natronolimnobius sp. AArcel1 TaxID=1679093 RepID=UPI0013ED283E|nr:NAD-dependent epimerase/dehydratase family protein [Natronolimnobius sp. AArcel1]NGM70324.1 NAD-dependent epimerase/dehydratase family protein [Natronolimnobius sp. AArcel1]